MLLTRPIEWSPNRLTNEQSHRMNFIPIIHREPMINSLGQRNQIPLLDMNPHPFVLFIPHVKIPRPSKDVSNFFRVVNVFFKEGFDFHVVVGQRGRVDGYDVGVGVATVVTEYGKAGVDVVLGVPGDGEGGIIIAGGI